jgi:hypothetical protein
MIRRSLPFEAWPEADRVAWTKAIAECDIFDGRGPAAHWAPTTRYTVQGAYGRYLSFQIGRIGSEGSEYHLVRGVSAPLLQTRLQCPQLPVRVGAGSLSLQPLQ